MLTDFNEDLKHRRRCAFHKYKHLWIHVIVFPFLNALPPSYKWESYTESHLSLGSGHFHVTLLPPSMIHAEFPPPFSLHIYPSLCICLFPDHDSVFVVSQVSFVNSVLSSMMWKRREEAMKYTLTISVFTLNKNGMIHTVFWLASFKHFFNILSLFFTFWVTFILIL